MRYDYYVVRFKDGVLVDSSPCAMTGREADSLSDLGNAKADGFSYKSKHRSELRALEKAQKEEARTA
jgi:hypothetical protein